MKMLSMRGGDLARSGDDPSPARTAARAGAPHAGQHDVTAAGGPSVWDLAADAFRRWRAGAPGAMEDLVAVMTPVLWNVVRAYGLGTAPAQDAVQGTWMALLRHAGSVADPQAIGSWLTTTARRQAWRTARATPPVTDGDEVLGRVVDRAGTPEDAAVAHDEEQRLWDCVDRLPERCRRLLRILAFEQRPHYEDIAADLGMPVGSIGPTRGRCLAKLRAALQAEGGWA